MSVTGMSKIDARNDVFGLGRKEHATNSIKTEYQYCCELAFCTSRPYVDVKSKDNE